MTVRAAPFVVAFKFGPKLFSVLSKALKSAKATKVGLGAASMASYSWLFTWEFAVVILLTLVVHEFGHVRAMKTVGIPTKGFYLIPFVGGAAVPERAFKSRMEEQFVAIAGPVFGLAQATVLYAIYVITDHPLAATTAAWVSLLNLFNLLPITPLDGGRIVKSITYSIGSIAGTITLAFGIALCVALMALLKSWLMAIILVIAVAEFVYERRSYRFAFVPPMSGRQTLRCFATYAFTCAAFVLLIYGCGGVPDAQLVIEVLRDS